MTSSALSYESRCVQGVHAYFRILPVDGIALLIYHIIPSVTTCP